MHQLKAKLEERFPTEIAELRSSQAARILRPLKLWLGREWRRVRFIVRDVDAQHAQQIVEQAYRLWWPERIVDALLEPVVEQVGRKIDQEFDRATAALWERRITHCVCTGAVRKRAVELELRKQM